MSREYDVAIVGASFAGLATAMQLRGHRVVLMDQYPVGAHPVSACGTPLATAKAVHAEAAAQEVHHALVLHTGGAEVRYDLHEPYITFDYRAFCEAMLARTDVDFWQTRVTELRRDGVITAEGSVAARFVVNAAGWRWQSERKGPAASTAQAAGYGLETELPVRLAHVRGLHFHFEKQIVRNGYAWVFPCGERIRIGVVSFEPGAPLRPRLARFLERFELQIGDTHGGVLPIERSKPVAGGVFCVGDAAGQCLPVTGEGIRTAIFHGMHCGKVIALALRGRLSPQDARQAYCSHVEKMDRFQARLLRLQMLIARTPEFLLAWGGRICAIPPLKQHFLGRYMRDSGWVTGSSAQG